MIFKYKIQLPFMSIVNLENITPIYKNIKDWINDPNNVYIGRAGMHYIDGEFYPKTSSPFYNPFRIGSSGEILNKYRTYLKGKLSQDKELFSLFLQLKDKNLGCWCNSDYCHGNVIIDLINQLDNKDTVFSLPCNICCKYVSEINGYQCVLCDKAWCNEHCQESNNNCCCPKIL